MSDRKLVLDNRLAAAASFVREKSVVSDVGTDHAFLPVSLILAGKSSFAVASDINKGPLERAVSSAEKYGVSDKMEFVLVGGIPDEECRKHNVTDIVVCGMGGELIEKIVSSSPYAQKSGVRLVLQPMSFAPELRKCLCYAGFDIVNEKLCKAAGRVYTVICAEYDGIKREYSDAELILGRKNIENREELFPEYAKKAIKKLETQIKGKQSGGIDCEYERGLLEKITAVIEE